MFKISIGVSYLSSYVKTKYHINWKDNDSYLKENFVHICYKIGKVVKYISQNNFPSIWHKMLNNCLRICSIYYCNSDKWTLSLAWFKTNGHTNLTWELFNYTHIKERKTRRHDCSWANMWFNLTANKLLFSLQKNHTEQNKAKL